MRRRRRRSAEKLSPARRQLRLRHVGAPDAGLGHALSARGRAGQFRLHRRRFRGGLPLHRVPPAGTLRRFAARHRRGHRRFSAQLQGIDHGADRAPERAPEPAAQRLDRDRRRHGDEHSAAQLGRARRSLLPPHRQPAAPVRGNRGNRQGTGLSDGRLHLRHGRHSAVSAHGPRDRESPRRRARRGNQERLRADRHHGNSLQRQPRGARQTHRGTRESEGAHGSPRPAQRVRREHAHRHRAEARRVRARRDEQALQAHRAGIFVRRDSARARPHASEADEHSRNARMLHRTPPRRHHAAYALPPAQGGGPRAHPRRLQNRLPQPRRFRPHHSVVERPRRGCAEAHVEIRTERNSGQGDSRHAPVSAHGT